MAPLNQVSQHESPNLFPLQSQVTIVEIKKTDVQTWNDRAKVLKQLVTYAEGMYPGIDRWFSSKVVPGIKTSERIAYIAYESDHPIATAILKRGDSSKFCHLSIHEDFRDQDLGQMFFTLMTLEIRHQAKAIHFTLPESLWADKSGFFKSFGFSTVEKSSRQYRKGDTELACSAPLATVWSAVLSKLPALTTKFGSGGYSMDGKLLFSIKPNYANQILAGVKLVEIRKKFSERWLGRRVVLYASHPQGALVGEATIHKITRGQPSDIWSNLGPQIGSSWSDFQNYTASSQEVSAIELNDIQPYLYPVPLDQVEYILQEQLRPPQSYCELGFEKNPSWTRAASIASLLHSKCSAARRDSSTPAALPKMVAL